MSMKTIQERKRESINPGLPTLRTKAKNDTLKNEAQQIQLAVVRVHKHQGPLITLTRAQTPLDDMANARTEWDSKKTFNQELVFKLKGVYNTIVLEKKEKLERLKALKCKLRDMNTINATTTKEVSEGEEAMLAMKKRAEHIDETVRCWPGSPINVPTDSDASSKRRIYKDSFAIE